MISLHRIPVVALAFFGTTACTIYPYNGQVLNHESDSLQFLGCSTTASSPITIQAQKAVAPFSWDTLGPIEHASATVSRTDSTGQNWFCWTTTRVIPAGYWVSGFPLVAPSATLRVLDQGAATWSFGNDPTWCSSQGIPALTNAPPCALKPETQPQIRVYASSL
jgi:hypothetical protein